MKIKVILAFLALILIFVEAGCERQLSGEVVKDIEKEEKTNIIPSPKILFSDDFSYGSGEINKKWEIVLKDGLTVSTKGMIEASGKYGKALELRGKMLKTGSRDWKNYTINTNIKVGSAPKHIANEIAFRMQDDDNYYLISIRPSVYGVTYIFYKVVDGESYEIKRSARNKRIDDEDWHNLKLIVEGDRYILFVDDEFIMEVKDDKFLQGNIALMTDPLSIVYFDDFVVIGY